MGRRFIFSLPFLISWALMGLFLIQMILTFILLWPVTSIEDVFLSISTNPNYLISRMFSVLLSLRFGWFDTLPEWLTFFYRLVTALTWIEISAIAVLPFLMASRLFGSRFPAELARAHLTWWSEIVIGVFMLSFVGVIIVFSLWPYPATVLLLIKVLLALLICGWIARLVYITLYRPFRHEHPIEPPHIEG